jgi:hypothetical protein
MKRHFRQEIRPIWQTPGSLSGYIGNIERDSFFTASRERRQLSLQM